MSSGCSDRSTAARILKLSDHLEIRPHLSVFCSPNGNSSQRQDTAVVASEMFTFITLEYPYQQLTSRGQHQESKLVKKSMEHLDELRRRVDDNIRAYQCRQKAMGANDKQQVVRNNGGNWSGRRMPKLLQQNAHCATILIWGDVPAETYAQNKCQKLETFTVSPLKVIVSNGSEQVQMIGASPVSSPASSIDSGMSSMSSPISSPDCSPISLDAAPFRYGKQKISSPVNPVVICGRGRSTSESTCGLKSILKKNVQYFTGAGRIGRSHSECKSIAEESFDSADDNPVEIQDSNLTAGTQKKRVVFSERLVQERSFRPNSSILGQKKKNQRKMRNKLKKQVSLDEQLSDIETRRRCTDSETSYDESSAASEFDETDIDPIEQDLQKCCLDDCETSKADSCNPEEMHQSALFNGPSFAKRNVYFTVGDDLLKF